MNSLRCWKKVLSFAVLTVAVVLMNLTDSNQTLKKKYLQNRELVLDAKTNISSSLSLWGDKEGAVDQIPVLSDGQSTNSQSVLHTSTNVTEVTKNSSVEKVKFTIAMQYPRSDRLGSNIQRPLFLMAYSMCHNYHFCIMKGREGLAKSFNFPSCSHDWENETKGVLFETPVNESGTYLFQGKDNILISNVLDDIDCAFQPSTRRIWRNLILDAQQFHETENSVVHQDFFNTTYNQTVVNVAVHIRRGDITKKKRIDVFIPDRKVVKAIEMIRDKLQAFKKQAVFHIFSEDYGDTNWTAYEGLVEDQHMHLVPKEVVESPNTTRLQGRPIDMDLNLRDWKHFVAADVLLIGGTFSRVAAYGRDDPNAATGLPWTIFLCKKVRCRNHLWSNATTFQIYGNTTKILNLPFALDVQSG